jgi:DNA polymerase elongation subunit (family B)
MLRRFNLLHKYETIANGEKIKFAYLKKPNPAKDYVISCPNGLPKELKMDNYIDYDMQFEKGYLSPIESITKTIGWQVEKIATLEDWF